MLLLIPKAVPSTSQLVQLWDGPSVIIPRRMLKAFSAARDLLTQPPVQPTLLSTLSLLLFLISILATLALALYSQADERWWCGTRLAM